MRIRCVLRAYLKLDLKRRKTIEKHNNIIPKMSGAFSCVPNVSNNVYALAGIVLVVYPENNSGPFDKDRVNDINWHTPI